MHAAFHCTPFRHCFSTGLSIPIPQEAAFPCIPLKPSTHASQMPFNHIPARKEVSMFHVSNLYLRISSPVFYPFSHAQPRFSWYLGGSASEGVVILLTAYFFSFNWLTQLCWVSTFLARLHAPRYIGHYSLHHRIIPYASYSAEKVEHELSTRGVLPSRYMPPFPPSS